MQEQRLPRRERERRRRRREILDAALEVFSEKGYHDVSMLEIARRADFAVGTLYKFFKNKEDLYKSLIVTKAEEYHRVLKEVLARDDDVVKVLKDYIATKVGAFADNVAALRLYLTEVHGASFNLKAGLDPELRKLYDELIEALASVFRSGIRKKVIRKLDPYQMSVALEGITTAFLMRWFQAPEKYPYDKSVSAITGMFLDGILADGSVAR